MNIGIYAGTFDPFHSGHLDFSIAALAAAKLQKVVIVAEKKPYRKQPKASWDHRQAMIEHATSRVEGADHDYAFASKLSHQHTMKDMLRVSSSHFGPGNTFWFLVGSDLFEHMYKWRDIADNNEHGGFIVALRDDHTEQWLTEKRLLMHKAGFNPKVLIIDSPRPHVSSSIIRAELSQGLRPGHLVESELEYITKHKLYI